jgi:hypothetical protein
MELEARVALGKEAILLERGSLEPGLSLSIRIPGCPSHPGSCKHHAMGSWMTNSCEHRAFPLSWHVTKF